MHSIFLTVVKRLHLVLFLEPIRAFIVLLQVFLPVRLKKSKVRVIKAWKVNPEHLLVKSVEDENYAWCSCYSWFHMGKGKPDPNLA
jgi:hypothetical protein